MCGLFITLILAASLCVVYALTPLTRPWLREYHVLLDAAVALVSYGLLSALVVQSLLKLKPMPLEKRVYRLDDPILTYWKLLAILYRLGQSSLGWCIPVFARPVLDALFGARIGRDAAFGGTIDDPFMVTVGDGVILGHGSLVAGNYIDKGQLVTGPVRIGNRVTIGVNAVILPNSTIGDDATIASGAVVGPGAEVGAGDSWRGNPARLWMPAAASRASSSSET